MNNTPVIGAAALQNSQPGQTVFVEWLISPSNRTMHRDWVAYIRQDGREYGDYNEEGDYETKIEWRETKKVPPLLLSTNSGLVQIEDPGGGNGYSLENPGRWSSEGRLRRYRGLEVNNQVVALGQIQFGSQGHYLDADMIARGTLNEYLAKQQNIARFTSLISIPLFVIGLLGLAGTLIRFVYRFGQSNI